MFISASLKHLVLGTVTITTCTVVYPFKWNTVFGNNIKTKMGILNLILKIYFNQKTLSKNIFLKFEYIFINAGIGWNFNILNVLC